METIYFLIFIGVCAFAVVWATLRSKAGTSLGSRSTPTKNKLPADKLRTPVDNRLAHKNELWEARGRQATKGSTLVKSLFPSSRPPKRRNMTAIAAVTGITSQQPSRSNRKLTLKGTEIFR